MTSAAVYGLLAGISRPVPPPRRCYRDVPKPLSLGEQAAARGRSP
ncbi:MAG TPA: hypothetical protein VFQ68_35145 [Streptosporangiaceae bacterium]|nr:hypothetical protein [Streptosporangiaceae bacterium]